ncbi:MAG: hypothetical protein HGA85_06845 [Nanoarchaeota archaeon]|nr:hypothetical protein [Nanoarchaeota archaeon]
MVSSLATMEADINATYSVATKELKKSGIAIPDFQLIVKPMESFEDALRQYYRQGNSVVGPLDFNEELFVAEGLRHVQDAPIVESPLAGEEGVIYTVTNQMDDAFWRHAQVHTIGHAIQRATNWQYTLSLAFQGNRNTNQTARDFLKEGFAVWFEYTYQDIVGLKLPVEEIVGIHSSHTHAEAYVKGFNFFNYIGNRFNGTSTVMGTLRKMPAIPLEFVLDPTLYDPTRPIGSLVVGYLQTQDPSMLLSMKAEYGNCMADYFQKKGFFVTPIGDSGDKEYDITRGLVIHLPTASGVQQMKFPFGQYWQLAAWESSAGEPYSIEFEDNFLAKISNKQVLEKMLSKGINAIEFGHETLKQPAYLERYSTPGKRLLMGFSHIVSYSVNDFLRYLDNPVKYAGG